ncbi:hypothetical protein OH77DRAFT_595537 [Trametes cingulata]|nr:hypothetical protein OH77DRAFT_595537 [Trametes cingulata]
MQLEPERAYLTFARVQRAQTRFYSNLCYLASTSSPLHSPNEDKGFRSPSAVGRHASLQALKRPSPNLCTRDSQSVLNSALAATVPFASSALPSLLIPLFLPSASPLFSSSIPSHSSGSAAHNSKHTRHDLNRLTPPTPRSLLRPPYALLPAIAPSLSSPDHALASFHPHLRSHGCPYTGVALVAHSFHHRRHPAGRERLDLVRHPHPPVDVLWPKCTCRARPPPSARPASSAGKAQGLEPTAARGLQFAARPCLCAVIAGIFLMGIRRNRLFCA